VILTPHSASGATAGPWPASPSLDDRALPER